MSKTSAKTSSRNIKRVIIVVTILIAVLLCVLFQMRPHIAPAPAGYVQSKSLLTIINPVNPANNSASTSPRTIRVLIADTPASRERGLSGMLSLPAGEGMLFLFDHSEKFGFWMPQMNFPIDMVWIDQSWRVVDVTHGATPASYPKTVFYPRVPAHYVLEINDNSANEWGIASGTLIQFHR